MPEIKIILIGGRDLRTIEASGKSLTGNIILGRDAFEVGRRTARCVKAEGEIHGRHVTVVDTPGWWWHYPVKDTPKFDMMEIMKSPTLCSPGPHAFLLVIPVDNVFPQVYRMAMEGHMEFLSENVWKHIIVLFSCISPHDDGSLKKHWRNWPDLQLVLRKCQNRYHVLNITDRDDCSQVITLLEKIEEMVAQNNPNYFEISKSVSMEDERERMKKEKVKQRILAVKNRRTELQARIKAEDQHLTDIQIVILGASWAARSSAGNLILGKTAFKVGKLRTTVCEVRHAEVLGKDLTVVDTPGWFWENTLEKTSAIDKMEIRHSVHLCPPGPHAILLTVPIATTFNKSYQTAVEEHMSLLGKDVWSHTFVLFTRGDWLGDTTIEERIVEEGEHLEWLMERCGYRYHVFNCKNHTDSTQVKELIEKIEEMVMENNGCCYEPDEKSNPSTELQLKMKKAKKDTKKRFRQKHILQELLKEREKKLSEIRIVLLGGERVGKSTTGNTVIQGQPFETTLDEGFKDQRRTSQCIMKQGKVEGCHVSVVDTPGWSASHLENAKEILRSVTVCSPGPHAFLLVLPLSECFSKKSEQTVMELMSLFGQHVWKHTLIIFSGYWLKDRPVEQYIACEGEPLQSLIKKCGNRYYELDHMSQIKNLLNKIEMMVARNRGEYFTIEKEEKKSSMSVFQKPLTEEEWNKREDELIERLLEAADMDLEGEFKQPTGRRRGSFNYIIPSMSGDSLSDSSSSIGVDALNPAFKVFQWLWHPRNKATSSGYETESTTSSSQHSKTEGIHDDIPFPQNHPSDNGTPKCTRNIREQKHARSSSI
ncbi:GTPase IMAP family member 8 [Danio aesculapii]|uniref:GTPase IMAP family member 8 n=1 Tax=Danio aesculapii TaxID=1142201 RepID=UPI0024C03000|nr:GTPase IMAP family member 8 [Danio aesculapii]